MFALWSDISTLTCLLLVLAAFTAGFVDAVAGGGGLIQLPALLFAFPNAPLASVLGSNKAVSIVGTSAAAATYRTKVQSRSQQLIPIMVTAFIGSLAGAALATRVDRAVFEPIIILILICVGIFTLIRPDFGTIQKSKNFQTKWAAPAFGLVIGFYDGLIGPGTGMFLLFGLVAIVGTSFLDSSATAKFVNVATNLAALSIFVPSGHVLWAVVLLMAPMNLLGGFIGARTALDKGSSFVRAIFVLMLAALLVRLVLVST
jgi:uncharacterized membrane protein YfcA